MAVTIEPTVPPLTQPWVDDGHPVQSGLMLTEPAARYLIALDANVAKIAADANTGPSGPSDIEWGTLTPGASVTIDLSGFKFKGKSLTPTADTVLAAPTGTQEGNMLFLRIVFGATTYDVTFNSAWKLLPEDVVIRLANTYTLIQWVVGPSTTISRVSFQSGIPT